MNLAAAFFKSVGQQQDKTAVFWGETLFSYRSLGDQAAWLAARLTLDYQVKPGARVGLWLKNRPEFIPALFAILQAGGVVVPINNFLKPDEVAYILNDAGIDLLITEVGMEDALQVLSAKRPDLRTFRVEDLPPSPAQTVLEPCIRAEGDLAIIIYTSGTTGHPKGAMLSHGNLLHNVESCRQVLQAIDFDRFVLLLPMFHSFMLCVCILLPLIVGGSIVLIRSVHPPKNIFMEIIAHQATILPAIPPLFRALANAPLGVKLPLRLCISGAAPLPGEILKEFTEKMALPLLEGYGLSEASPVVSMNPILGPWKAGSIGKVIPDVEISIQNEDGEILPVGEVGEICVRGGNVMQGYWNQPDETAKALKNGWLLTGDIGYGDADGYYYITDRKKDMLLVNGINVYPREIEEVLYRYPGVKEAAVIGKPDARKGESPVAFVSANEGVVLDEKSIIHFLREHLADYKVPRQVHFLPTLPRNATGKILKTSLRQLHV